MLHDASEAKRLVGIGSPVHAGVRTGITSKKGERDDKKWRNEQEGEARELGLENRTESKTMHASVYVQLRRQRGK